MAKSKKVNRSAKDGQFVSDEEAKDNPDTTVSEQLSEEEKEQVSQAEQAEAEYLAEQKRLEKEAKEAEKAEAERLAADEKHRKQVEAEEAGRPQAELDKQAEARADGGVGDEPMPEPSGKGKRWYFRSWRHSALSIWDGQRDIARFVPYYDVFKGDTVRVGYLVTDNKKVADRCLADDNVEEITKADYDLAMNGDGKRHEPLKRAPIQAA